MAIQFPSNVTTIAPGIDKTDYFPPPYSLFAIDQSFRVGLLMLGALGLFSVMAVLPLIAFITYRLIAHRDIHHNQPVMLCFNLLIADTFQALAFLLSFHWVVTGGILAPSGWCQVQAAVLNMGDLSSGFFVLSIALHTCYTVVRGRKLPQTWFLGIVSFIWLFSIFLSVIGPILHGDRFFARSGGWCWISPKWETERLVCHYLWTFINEFGTVVIYAFVFTFLNRKMKRVKGSSDSAAISANVSRATRFMVLYPLVFVIATLPLAVGRMASAAGKTPPTEFFFAAGALLASCGWLDAVLYTLTRRILVYSDVRIGAVGARRLPDDDPERSNGLMSATVRADAVNPWRNVYADCNKYSPTESKELTILTHSPSTKSRKLSQTRKDTVNFSGKRRDMSSCVTIDSSVAYTPRTTSVRDPASRMQSGRTSRESKRDQSPFAHRDDDDHT